MSRIVIISLLTLIFGLIIGLNLSTTPMTEFEESSPLSTSIQGSEPIDRQYHELETRITSLENILNREVNKHEALKKELATVKKQIFALPNSTLSNHSSLPEQQKNRQNKTNRSQTPRLMKTKSATEILLSLGVDKSITETIKKRTDERELEQIFLRNRATREGWYGTESYFEEAKKLETSTNFYREELGDDKYDQYLYESGQYNRVSVVKVLSSSPAANADIKTGDIIYSYDGIRLFSWTELTELTSQGVAGEPVAVEIQRDQQVFEIYIPRGPLGVRLSGKKINPI